MVIWFLCSLIAVEKTYIVSMYALCDVQCERQPFLVPRYSIKIIITTSFYCRFYISASTSHSFFLFFILHFAVRVVHCVYEWMGHVGTQCTYLLQHFTKWHVFIWLHYANLCVASATANEKSLNLCTIHMVFFIPFQSNSMHFILFSFSSVVRRENCYWKRGQKAAYK